MVEWFKSREDRERIVALAVMLGLAGYTWLKRRAKAKPGVSPITEPIPPPQPQPPPPIPSPRESVIRIDAIG